MDKAGAPGPVVFRDGIGDHRHIAQIGQCGLLSADPVVQVQVFRPAPAPVKRGGPVDTLELHVFEQCLDRREAGARSQQHNRFDRVFAQKEAAVRTFNAQDFFFFHRAEHMVGELAARHVTQMQFQPGAGFGQRVWRIGHRVAAPRAIAQQEIDILTGVKLQRLAGGQLQAQLHHVVRQLFQRQHAHRHLADREGTGLGNLARRQHHIALRVRAAGQHEAIGFFLGAQCFGLMRSERDAAGQHLAFARAAGTVLAAIGQANALADASGQNGFIGQGREVPAARLDRYVKADVLRGYCACHGYSRDQEKGINFALKP